MLFNISEVGEIQVGYECKSKIKIEVIEHEIVFVKNILFPWLSSKLYLEMLIKLVIKYY